jgi:hypothetical protein
MEDRTPWLTPERKEKVLILGVSVSVGVIVTFVMSFI